MINKEKTLANLIELSFADLESLKQYSGTWDKGWRPLIAEAITIKLETIIIND